ncbi:hypothetical protein [Geosporobacter ferrireducens]|uniref:Uncharacterized protein n=1 Tax=Geosporobacter ferrireducens TaxID=1424294 RepID=A0A1D8GEQ7_9FIRM|nr:hypothetical protein [Geosporobacter ferrireducens]AOT69399.1 hypothetical protein Gferi_07325 [Geosporobacter ferrireducens]MTI56509.1 hypothetical protein [Geosporobacter ferrireducens]
MSCKLGEKRIVPGSAIGLLAICLLIGDAADETRQAYNEEIRYFVENNKISVNISLRFTHGSYIGYFIVNYKYSNNNLIIEQINFTAGGPNSYN